MSKKKFASAKKRTRKTRPKGDREDVSWTSEARIREEDHVLMSPNRRGVISSQAGPFAPARNGALPCRIAQLARLSDFSLFRTAPSEKFSIKKEFLLAPQRRIDFHLSFRVSCLVYITHWEAASGSLCAPAYSAPGSYYARAACGMGSCSPFDNRPGRR